MYSYDQSVFILVATRVSCLLAEFAKNIKDGEVIYWFQGLCASREKSLALGERGLKGFDRAKCPSANFNDNVLKPVTASLSAKMVYCNIRDVCIRDGANCLPATKRPKGWLKLFVPSPNLPTEKSQIHLSELRWDCEGASIVKARVEPSLGSNLAADEFQK